MKNITYLRFNFENTESIIIPIMYVVNIQLDIIINSVYMERNSFGKALKKCKKLQKGLIDINKAFKEDLSYQPFLYDTDICAYERILKYKDLVQIDVGYNDCSYDSYHIIWDPTSDEINEYQRTIEYTNKLRIEIDGMEE